jgi:hypothetical protein
LIDLNAGTVFLREVATAGGNVHTTFGGENHFRLKCSHRKKGNVQEASIHWQHKAFVKGI